MPVDPCEKPKSTPQEQVALLKDHGVRFDIMGENDAIDFLCNHNFFFKIKAYDKNFDKYQNVGQDNPNYGHYTDLDFAYLVELSRLDKELRYLIMAAALDIEHYIKVRLNKALMEDDSCDGYQIVEDFMDADAMRKTELIAKTLKREGHIDDLWLSAATISDCANRVAVADTDEDFSNALREIDSAKGSLELALGNLDLNHIEKSISRLEGSSYSKHVAKKYGHRGSMAYWAFLELATFGDIISFYKFYFNDYRKTKDEVAKRTKPMLFPTKTLRNAAAHNSCLLHELRARASKPVGQISKFMVETCGINRELAASTKRVPVVHDFGAMLITYDAIVISESSRTEMSAMLARLSERFDQHLDYFAKQAEVVQALQMISETARAFSSRLKTSPERLLASGLISPARQKVDNRPTLRRDGYPQAQNL